MPTLAHSISWRKKEDGRKHLVFKLTQNDSHSVPFARFELRIDKTSSAGYAADTGQILNIEGRLPHSQSAFPVQPRF